MLANQPERMSLFLVYRHLASNQRSANKKQVKEQLHSRKQTEHVKKLKT